jgi:hypothetical protein
MTRLIVVAASLALAACGATGERVASAGDAVLATAAAAADAAGAKAPAPLAGNSADEKAVATVWTAFDAALDGINALRRADIIHDGSSFARSLADAVDKTTAALTAASAAARAGNTTSYVTALNEARAALLNIRDLLRKGA